MRICVIRMIPYDDWHPEKDLNSHLAVLETVVLAVELSRHMEERVGFEPTEHFALRFSGPTPLAGLGHLPKLAVRTGVEPVTPG